MLNKRFCKSVGIDPGEDWKVDRPDVSESTLTVGYATLSELREALEKTTCTLFTIQRMANLIEVQRFARVSYEKACIVLDK